MKEYSKKIAERNVEFKDPREVLKVLYENREITNCNNESNIFQNKSSLKQSNMIYKLFCMREECKP